MVSEEHDTSSLALGALVALNPLARSKIGVEAANEAKSSTAGVAAVVLTHDSLDGLGSFVGVVEGDGADVVVQDVSLDNAVEEVRTDWPKIAVDCCGGATSEGPGVAGVVGK